MSPLWRDTQAIAAGGTQHVLLSALSATLNALGGGALEAFSIDGVWGYVPHYPTCWQDTAVDVPVGGMTAGSTSLTLVSTAAFLLLCPLLIWLATASRF